MKKLFTLMFLCHSFGAGASETFLWGAASSSFQVEGSPAPSDWLEWTKTPGKILDATNANTACEFFKRFDEDFKIAQSLNFNSYRISVAWERIYPAENKFDPKALETYKQMILSMRKHGLEPVVSLHHFVLPLWLAKKGGLVAGDFASHFAEYSESVVRALSVAPYNVKYWLTFNEPNVMIHGGYIQGDWPPGFKGDMKNASIATAQVIRAHVAAFNKIKVLDPSLKVSIAHHWRVFEANQSWNPLSLVAAKVTDKLWNDQIISSMLSGDLMVWMPGGELIRDKLELKQKPGMDYLGINYYGRAKVGFKLEAPFIAAGEGPGPKTDLGWEMYPQGLEIAIKDAYARYNLPVMITENGLADKEDRNRAQFIKDHVAAVKSAQAAGVPVLGYLHWSLTDNFEWAHGLGPRFGLVEIDYAAGAKRKIRPSAFVYRDLIRQ